MSAAALASLVENLPHLYGPLIVGSVCAAILAGALCNQAIQYFHRFRGDRLHHRLVVGAMLFISVIACAGNIAIMWWTFIRIPWLLMNEPARLGKPSPWYFDIIVAAPGAATVLSQLFFAYRGFHIADRNKLVGGSLLFLCIGHAGCFVFACVWGLLPGSAPLANGTVPISLRRISAISLWVGAGADIAISMTLWWILRSRKKGFNPNTDSLLSYIGRISLTTGAITAVMATATAAVLVATQNDPRRQNYNITLAMMLPHVTGLVVTGTLNIRNPDQDGSTTTGTSRPGDTARNTSHSQAHAPHHARSAVGSDMRSELASKGGYGYPSPTRAVDVELYGMPTLEKTVLPFRREPVRVSPIEKAYDDRW